MLKVTIVAVIGLVGCGDVPLDAEVSGAQDTGRALEGVQEGSGRSPGRRGALHDVLDQDPNNAEALAELGALDEQSDAEFGLVYKLEMGPNRLVKFYEPDPGVLVYFEKSPLEGTPLLKPSASLDETWSSISNEPVPEALLEVRARAQSRISMASESEERASPAAPSARPSAPAAAPMRRLAHAGSANHFTNDHNGCRI